MQRKILVAEDAPLLRELAELYLSTLGRVLLASTGAEALAIARRERPDLVVADLFLPELDGAKLCRILHSDPELAGIPVVILSASDGAADRARAIEAGAADVLPKPIERDALLEAAGRFFRPPAPEGQPRIDLEAPIRIVQADGTASGTVRNLSRGGVFVECKSTLEPHTRLALEIALPETEATLAPTAEVIWSRSAESEQPPGMGLRFLALDGKSVRRLVAYIQERRRRQRRAPVGAEA
jgi:uncharacterized protein (TIGR02266 family)